MGDSMVGRSVRFRRHLLPVVALLAAGCGDDLPRRTSPEAPRTLLLGGDLDIAGLTTEDVAAVVDQQRGALAVDVASGDAQTVDAAAGLIAVDGPAVVAFRNFDFVTSIGDMTVWTRATGAVTLARDATTLHLLNVGTGRMLLSEATSSDGTTTQLVVKALDGTLSLPVATVSRLGSCFGRAEGTPTAFVVAYCAPGSQTVVVAAIDPMTGAMTSLNQDGNTAFRVVPGSETVAMVSATHEGSLVTTAGQLITRYGSNVDALTPAPDGSAVYIRAQGSLRRAPVDGSAPVELVASGVASIRAVSTTGRQLLFNGKLATRNSYGSLLLASGVVAGPVATLVSTLDGTTFGSAFTADESRVLYFSSADDDFVGTLRSRDVNGGDDDVLGEHVWTAHAYARSRVVFTADYFEVPKRVGHATVEAVDTSGGGAPTIISTDAGADAYVTAAGDQVVFSYHPTAGDGPGLYVAPLP
jgi:hypothetical protein